MEQFKSDKFGGYVIVEHLANSKVKVRFVDTDYEYVCYKSQALNGQVRDLFRKTFYNVGYIGGTQYSWTKSRKSYSVWTNMLKRCYDENRLMLRPSWRGCTVADVWHNYQNFAKWYEDNQIADDCDLDKDLLVEGNRVYSPDTCCLIPNEINCAINTGKDTFSGVFPTGASSKTYKTQVSHGDTGLKYGGCYNSKEEAAQAYRTLKKLRITELAERYKESISVSVYAALLNWQPTTQGE